MTPTPKLTSGATARADAVGQDAPRSAPAGPFVLNLCSSTTPMALPKAEQPELSRFSFFVSRRFEEGRERFRLHMGYFATLAEAEEWLGAVRDIYPGAWAGEAPGKKLRERAVAAAAAQARHAAGPPPLETSATIAGNPGVSPAKPVVPVAQPAPGLPGPDINVPTLHAATPSSGHTPTAPTVKPASPRVLVDVRAPITSSLVKSVSRTVSTAAPRPVGAAGPTPAARSSAAVTPTAPALTRLPQSTSQRAAAPLSSRTPASPPTASRTSASPSAASRPSAEPAVAQARGGNRTPPLSAPGVNPLRAPGVSSPPHVVPAAGPARTPVMRSAPPQSTASSRSAAKPAGKPALPGSNVREVLAALSESPKEATGETRLMPAPVMPTTEPADDVTFTDTQVLKFLETRRADGNPSMGLEAESGAISLLKPDDTGTRRALKQAVTDNAPVWFAVQLQWSVQPIELVKVPPLAIFSAYTLYTVEGSRDARKWYGLRLGFFSDAISAKQVAYYVRSEFTSVAVVPVSPQERTRASDADKKAAEQLASPKRPRSGPTDEFKLIDSDLVPASAAAAPVRKADKPATAGGAAAKAGAKGSRVRARERRGPQTLEETLEILGASELEIDTGTGETLNESGVRHLRVEVQKNTPFSRLLERLSEKVRKA